MFGSILYLAVGIKIIRLGIEWNANLSQAHSGGLDCENILKGTGSLSIIAFLVYSVEAAMVGIDMWL